MRRSFAFAIMVAFFAACSTKEIDTQTPLPGSEMFYATFEQPAEDGTRVFANEDLLLRWTADDRVSIFNKVTYNQEYRFTGETGDNGGTFGKVGDEFATGNSISHIVSVYPYQKSTKISENENLTIELPAEQLYAENTFGLGANTMVSVTSDNLLQYKNVGGYLVLKLYGENVSVSSITLKGNNSEKLAGKATVSMPVNGVPTTTITNDPTSGITLTCATPVQLGATADESTQFWFVVPPVTFSKGLTITVTGDEGVFNKSTEKKVVIERNILSRMSPIEVELSQPKNVIYYTSSDESVVTLNFPEAFGAAILSNEYVDGVGIITFDGDVTSIGNFAFLICTSLTNIIIPDSVTSIGDFAFQGCTGLTNITIPGRVTSIGRNAFENCTSLTNIIIPGSVTSIGDSVFTSCTSLTNIIIPDSVTSIGGYAFDRCSSLISITIPDSVTSFGIGVFRDCLSLKAFFGRSANPDGLFLIDSGRIIAFALGSFGGDVTIPAGVTSIGDFAFSGCTSLTSITIPDSVKIISQSAFSSCTSLTSITIPESVTSIEYHAFQGCTGLTSIMVLRDTPPFGDDKMFEDTNNCPILVPAERVDAYKTALYWSDYADRILAIGTPQAIDLGLPSGLKWASFNLGATKPEEYGDYYAWGETEPYYSNLDPLTWKDGKSKGYGWSSYKWCNVSDVVTLTKYCYMNGYNDYTDTKTVLDLDDDAACLNLGSNWRMPTEAEWTELMENCNWTWTTQNQVNGIVLTGPNGNEIFLPTSGGRWRDSLLDDVGSKSVYWSSSLSPSTPYFARCMHLDSSDFYWTNDNRCRGLSVRPVYAE